MTWAHVAQGYILRPLYIIYVNDIGYSWKGNVLSFADDTTLYASHSYLTTLHKHASEQINDVWRPAISVDIHVDARTQRQDVNVYLRVHDTKYQCHAANRADDAILGIKLSIMRLSDHADINVYGTWIYNKCMYMCMYIM